MKNIFSKVFVTLAISGVVISCNKDEAINEQNNNVSTSQQRFVDDYEDNYTLAVANVSSVTGSSTAVVNQKVTLKVAYLSNRCNSFSNFVEVKTNSTSNIKYFYVQEAVKKNCTSISIPFERTTDYEFTPSEPGKYTFYFQSSSFGDYEAFTVNVVEDPNHYYKIAPIYSVEKPKPFNPNLVDPNAPVIGIPGPSAFKVTYGISNTCGSFYKFIETKVGNTIIVKAQAVYSKNFMCGQVMSEGTEEFILDPFKYESGEYKLIFKSGYGNTHEFDIDILPIMYPTGL